MTPAASVFAFTLTRSVVNPEADATSPNEQSTMIVESVVTVQMSAVKDHRLLIVVVIEVIRRDKVAAVDDHIPMTMRMSMTGATAMSGMC